VTPVRRPVAQARRAALLLAGVLLLGACGSGTSSTADGGPTSGPPSTATSSDVPTSPSTSSIPSAPSTGTSDHPATVTATTHLLDWQSVPGSTRDLVTVGGHWRLTVDPDGTAAHLKGPHPRTIRAGAEARISDAFLDGTHALVVSEDKLAQTPDVATLVDLGSGSARTLDRSSTPPTSVGGTWALGPDTLAHATAGPHGSYCVTWLSLGSLRPEADTCVPPRNGLSRASITADGATVMRFDNHHPSCRTLLSRAGAHAVPLPGVAACQGWDSAAVSGGAVWSVIPNERRIEAGHFYAHTASGWYDLGPGTSGSLVACGGAAYFVRDPATRQDPATLLRWDPADAGLTTVFASKGRGNAFLSPPRCGGDHLTVTAFAAAGDQQVTTNLG
jgi:hypothetical protein